MQENSRYITFNLLKTQLHVPLHKQITNFIVLYTNKISYKETLMNEEQQQKKTDSSLTFTRN